MMVCVPFSIKELFLAILSSRLLQKVGNTLKGIKGFTLGTYSTLHPLLRI